MPSKRYYVYLLASKSRTLYIGITSNLRVRIYQHLNGTYDGFTKRYRVTRLIYYETFGWAQEAINREKQLKGWRRDKKVALIERENPTWDDLSKEWRSPAELRYRKPSNSSNSGSLDSPAKAELARDDNQI